MPKKECLRMLMALCFVIVLVHSLGSTHQIEQSRVFVMFWAQPQNVLTQLFRSYYDCFDLNVTITTVNQGSALFSGGRLQVRVIAPTGWYVSKEVNIPQLKAGYTHSSYVILYSPLVVGEYRVTVWEFTSGATTIAYEGGFLPLNIKSGTDFWTNTGVLIAALGVLISAVGIVWRRAPTRQRRTNRR